MLITGKRGRWREELPDTAARWLLTPAWLAFRPLVALRNAAFNHGWRRIHQLPVPVWSVGNITAGGTGKTPLTRYLATWALTHGLRPAIIARGYGSKVGEANDEAQTVSECPVFCNPDRVAGAQHATAAGANCLILDDAFQHRRIHRDLDIVMIDATRPWGSRDIQAGMTLPLGYLRESRQALQRAHLLALSRADLISATDKTLLLQQLATYGKPIIQVSNQTPALAPLLGGESETPISVLHGKPVLLVSGIGNPLGFELAAQQYGWQVVESLRFPDHYHYTRDDVKGVTAIAQRHQATVVMTGKDAVKWRKNIAPIDASKHLVLHMASSIAESDQPQFDDLLQKTLRTSTT
jgi:tetraacyldisaccharide 4'-kinase